MPDSEPEKVESSTDPQQVSSSLFSRLRLVSLLTLASRLLGLVRDIAMAALFGNGMILDAFSVAFRIPNMARRLFGEGALTAAFLPAFVREVEAEGKGSAWRLTSAVFTVLATVLCGLVLVGELLLWAVSYWVDTGAEAELLIGLTAVMLPYLVFICLAALLSAMLQALGHFTWPALLPVLMNVVWLTGIWAAHSWQELPTARIHTIAWFVLVAGVVQLIALSPVVRGFGFRFAFDWESTQEKVRHIGRGMLPILIGLSVTQFNTLADSLIAWGLAEPDATLGLTGSSETIPGWALATGTASALYFGQRLYQFPLGVFGVALGTVLFPRFSRHAEQGRHDELRDDLLLGLKLVLAIGIPASVGLVLLAEPLTTLLFQRGAFDVSDTTRTAEMIAAYGIGVWAYCGLLIVHRVYYAVGDRLTPLRVGLIAVVVNLGLNFALIQPFGGRGLALATSFTAMLQILTVVALLQSRVGRLDWQALLSCVLRVGLASVCMAATCLATLSLIGNEAQRGERLMRVALPVVASIVVYALAARLLGIREVGVLIRGDRNSPTSQD
jgi:putative peptidoglycan lipid II flippase